MRYLVFVDKLDGYGYANFEDVVIAVKVAFVNGAKKVVIKKVGK
jgi:hypothetical protein